MATAKVPGRHDGAIRHAPARIFISMNREVFVLRLWHYALLRSSIVDVLNVWFSCFCLSDTPTPLPTDTSTAEATNIARGRVVLHLDRKFGHGVLGAAQRVAIVSQGAHYVSSIRDLCHPFCAVREELLLELDWIRER